MAPSTPAQGPIRTCIGCRRRDAASDLLRVVARGSTLVPDPQRHRPGRGASVHLDPDCVSAARPRWARALRLTGPVDDAAVRTAVGHPPTVSESEERAVRTSTR